MEKKLYTVIIYSENLAGVLNQVTAEFTRRQMNIETLNVSSSAIEGVHRYTVSLWSEEDVMQKVIKRLEKRIDVIKADFYTENEIFLQEVALYKISTPKLLTNRQISKVIRHNNARVIEVNATYAVVEQTGKTDAIMKLYKELVIEQCVLQFVKSGHVALTRDTNEKLCDYIFNEDANRKHVNNK